MQGMDLRGHQDSDAVLDAFSALVSGGKVGYKTIIQKDKKRPVCLDCGKYLSGDENFCPECGKKIKIIE